MFLAQAVAPGGGARPNKMLPNPQPSENDPGVHADSGASTTAPPAELPQSRAASDAATQGSRQQCAHRPSMMESVHGPVGVFVADAMRVIIQSASRIASTKIPVLITGESGTGKEVLARFIHQQSSYAARPFIAFNCATVPRDMIDSQLFGYRRGAFTGACASFPGVIRAADGGTLFLDEIGELRRDVQPKLLRFLESGEVYPLGESHPVTVSVRIVAATNADLDQLTRIRQFREDLFYRLTGFRYRIPPLRERKEEIPALVAYFLQKYLEELAKPNVGITQEALDCLLRFEWPGNIRQLANELRCAVALAEEGDLLRPEHFSPDILGAVQSAACLPERLSAELTLRLDQPLASALRFVEHSMITYALRETCGKVERAAKLLGLSRKGLYLKRHRFSL